MPTVAIFRTELDKIQLLLTRQSAIVDAQESTTLHATQCEVFCRKIEQVVGMTVDAVTELTEIISRGSWTAAQKGRLTVCLNDTLTTTENRSVQGGARRVGQEISSFQHWAVQEEADILSASDMAFSFKIKTVISMMRRMGLILASERSKGHIFKCMLAACPEFTNTQDSDSAWVLFQDYKRLVHLAFKNTRDPGPMGYITDYPEKPEQLPESQRQLIFVGQPPVQLFSSATALSDVDQLFTFRGNSGKLSVNKKQPLQLQLGGQQQSMPMMQNVPMMGMCNPMQMQQMAFMYMQQMQQFQMQQAAGMHQQNAGEVPMHLFPGMTGANGSFSRKRSQLKLEDAHSPAGSAAGQLALADESPDSNASNASPPGTPRAGLQGMLPNASPTTMSPAEQAKRFLDAMSNEPSDPAGDNAEGESDDDVCMRRPAAKGKSKAKAKAKAKAKGTGKGHVKADHAKVKNFIFKPKIELEATRNHYLCRPGLPFSVCGESSACFKFSAHGGKKGAYKKAQEWLSTFKRTHKCE